MEALAFRTSRHEAINMLAKKLNVLELERITGNKDIRRLQVYYHEPTGSSNNALMQYLIIAGCK